MTDKRSFVVCYPDPKEAMEALERARFEFQCLLDYVAHAHPRALGDEYGYQLEVLREELDDEIQHVWMKHL